MSAMQERQARVMLVGGLNGDRVLRELDAERKAHEQTRAISLALAEALKVLKEDYADSEGCYCGQLVQGCDAEGQPRGVCGFCLTRAALAQYTAQNALASREGLPIDTVPSQGGRD